MSTRFHYHLSAPVLLVTKGRGVERFDDSQKLFARLEEIPELRDSILTIQWGARGAVTEDGIAALETLLWLEGLQPLDRAGRRAGAPYSRPRTRWAWQFLSDYLGWEWRPLA